MKDILVSLVVASVCATGFGLVFGIRVRELPYAALAGFLTRIVIILCETAGFGRFLYTFLTALAGTVYAELVGRAKRSSIAKYMYPAMVLLIPGDVLYKLILALLGTDGSSVLAETVTLCQSLFGIALGCMLGAMVFNIRRRTPEK